MLIFWGVHLCSLALCKHWWRTACKADLCACIASVPEPKTTGLVYLVTPGRCPWFIGRTQGPQQFKLLLQVTMVMDTLNFNSAQLSPLYRRIAINSRALHSVQTQVTHTHTSLTCLKMGSAWR